MTRNDAERHSMHSQRGRWEREKSQNRHQNHGLFLLKGYGMCDYPLWSISFSVYASYHSFCKKKIYILPIRNTQYG
ncbi:hypothetical protein BGP_2189 [Beggiatoa sp. PS]|nr:hypothetical protein BGP_2189 [Beggiatoa sp. PS]